MRPRSLLPPMLLTVALLSAPLVAHANERVTIALGGTGTLDFLPVEVAHALGYFTEQGIDASLQYFQSGTHSALAVIGGSAEFSANAFDHAVKAATQGKRLTAIAAFTETPGHQIVMGNRYREAVRELPDLKGRPIGVTAFGASTHLVLTYVLSRSGFKAEEINAVPVGADGLAAALEHDRVQGVVVAGLHGPKLLDAGRGFILLDLRTRAATEALFGGPYLKSGLLASAEVVAKRPETCTKVAAALVKATRWIAAHSAAEVASALPATLVQDRRIYVKAVEETREGFSKSARIDPRAVETVITSQRAFGLVPEGVRIDPALLFDNRFVDRALASGS